MPHNTITKSQKQIGSLFLSAFFILAGIITLYDTTHYSDMDSKIFPQAIALILITCAALSILLQYLKPTAIEGLSSGSRWRQILLVATLLIACALIPYIGFLLASNIAFLGAMFAAMHEPWSGKKLLLYISSGVVIIGTFYWLFRYVLLVPLP